MLKICLTYDYELFMGKNNAPADEILFTPTEKLKCVMDEFGVKGVFFADVCSAIAHRNAGLLKYSDSFDNQLRCLVSAGHDVQLHLHTSWYKAKKHNGELLISQDGYRIHEFGFDESAENSVQKIVRENVSYLNSVCRSVRDDYNCIAYRAGGFCIQPETELLKALLDNGIIIDSSVVPKYYALDGVNCSDFREVPNKLNWYISPESGVSVESSCGIYEVPMATVKPRLVECLFTSKSERSLPGTKPKGEYVKFENQNNAKKKNKLKRKFELLFDYRFISLDSRHYKAVIRDIDFIYRKYKLYKKDAYICLICHPKIADEARIENIKNLISHVLKEPDRYSFVTMSQISKEIQV